MSIVLSFLNLWRLCSFFFRNLSLKIYLTLQALANGFDGLYYNRSKPLNIVLVFCVVILCVFTFWVPYCDVCYDFAWKLCSFRVYLQLFVGWLMSYLRYLCLFANSGVQHILCCVFGWFVFVLCTLCCQFLWIVHFACPFGIL